MARVYNATGLTLSAHKYGDTGRVVHFLTREYGKVEAAVRGIGKPGSKLAAAVEPMTLSQLQFARGRGGLERLTQAQVVESYLPLRKDPRRLAYVGILLELTDRLTEPEEPLPALWDDLKEALDVLASGAAPELIVEGYTLRLLSYLGMAPEIEQCLECGQRLEGPAAFVPAQGGFLCAECAPASQGRMQAAPETLAALRLLKTRPIAEWPSLSLADDIRRQIAQIVQSHVDYHVGVSLKSRKFLDKIERF